MRIDCENCAGRGVRCGDCVVAELLGGPPEARSAVVVVPFGTRAAAGSAPPRLPARPDEPRWVRLSAADQRWLRPAGRRAEWVRLDDGDRAALALLAAAELVPPLTAAAVRPDAAPPSESGAPAYLRPESVRRTTRGIRRDRYTA